MTEPQTTSRPPKPRTDEDHQESSERTADRLYSVLVEEEDGRVCKDIPPEACRVVPGNFFKIGASHTLTKLADELSNAKTVLPWLLTTLGAPSSMVGILVPLRESGSLLPQLVIASAVRTRPRRKEIWILGGLLQAASLLGMAATALLLTGWVAGTAILGLLGLYSLARGLASVASKDVTGKTVPKTRRGRLTGFTTSVSGVLALALGGLLALSVKEDPSAPVLALILGSSAALWLGACAILGSIREPEGATGGGRNALEEARGRLKLLRTDPAFRRFVWVRALLISTALAGPYYVVLAREHSGNGNLLAMFVLASGLAAALSSGFWGRFSDRSSRAVLLGAAFMASSLGVAVFLLDSLGFLVRFTWLAPLAYFLLAIAHSGVRIGRKTYILDLATGERRTDYVAVSNTLIGVALVLAGGLGFLSPVLGPGGMLLLLASLGFAGVLGGRGLPEAE